MSDKERIKQLEREHDELRNALRRFASLGDAKDYPKRPNRLDVPFEWCESADILLARLGER